MAVINGLRASVTGFTVNNATSSFQPNIGTYGTSDILNGGELLENELIYSFEIQGLLDHTVSSISVKSLLLDNVGELLTESRNITMSIKDFGNIYSGNFTPDENRKTIIDTTFTQVMPQEENSLIINLHVQTNSINSVYYGLQSLVIDLSDVNYSVQINFSGPTSGRSPGRITAATLLISKGAVPVTFSKDPTTRYDSSVDNVEGRIYMKQDGIYVDGYQYGVVVPATTTQLGLVKLFDNFETDEDGGIVAPDDVTNVAATPKLVYNAIGSILAEITAPDVFIEEEVIPETNDEEELPEGVEVTPIKQDRQITNKFVFSDEFEARGEENRIHIKWLEII